MAGGKAKILWFIPPWWYMTPNKYGIPVVRNTARDSTHTGFSSIKVKLQTEVSVADIAPNFSIQEGEIKMILEGCMYSEWNGPRFGLSIVKPKAVGSGFYNQIVIFTPKSGLFSETAPE